MTTFNTPFTARTSKRCLLKVSAALAVAALGLPMLASAQDTWPSKPLRLIVGYPAGSSPDIQARLLSEPLSKALGQAVVVDNKPGASGNIGTDMIAKATDGYTIGIVGNGPLTSSKFLYARLPYDPLKDLAPIALIGAAPLVWVAPKASVTTPVPEYFKQVRASGDKMAYGSTGPGSGGHLGMELVKQQLGFNALHVPYTGGPAIMNAMLGGQLQAALLPAVTVMPMVQSGQLAALAVSSAKRSPLAPDLASMEEIGVKGVNIEVWNAIMAPASMPAASQARLNAEIGKILNSREMRQKLFAQGWKVEDTAAAALAQRIRKDTAVYSELISSKGIKLD
ncbi:MAG: tripartite tricarboxylate transporter substrate binding protein [Polaromonas sp.]|nr:tripartite tricarboxylate transporter substrate binding protein [Polaromonas sp.]